MTDDPADETEPPAAPEGTAGGGGAAPLNAVTGLWQDVIADMEATAEGYRERGWTVVEVHPGDVAVPEGREGGRWGLDVLVPDGEFDEMERLVEGDPAFDESEVYRGKSGGLVLLVVAMLDPDTEHAILFPVYYDEKRARDVLDRAIEEGELPTHLRPLDERAVVTFRHEAVDLFLPDDDA
ncbi:MAG: hypothetical protein V5A23_00300 [Halobacteriales archaeon]